MIEPQVLAGAEPFYAENGKVGVLVSHGYTGNPQSMRYLAEGRITGLKVQKEDVVQSHPLFAPSNLCNSPTTTTTSQHSPSLYEPLHAQPWATSMSTRHQPN